MGLPSRSLNHRLPQASGGLNGDLLAGYSGPALHRPDRIPRRRDRCACQNVVKLGEQQVIPGDIEPSLEIPSRLFAVNETLDETPALIQEVLATLLLLLDVVHHAVTAWESVLQLVGYDRETISVVFDSVEEVLGRAEP